MMIFRRRSESAVFLTGMIGHMKYNIDSGHSSSFFIQRDKQFVGINIHLQPGYAISIMRNKHIKRLAMQKMKGGKIIN